MRAHRSKAAAALLLAVLAAGIWTVFPTSRAADAGQAPGEQLEGLLKQLGLTYFKVSPTAFKLVIELQDNETVIIIAEATRLPWKDRKENPVDLATVNSKLFGPLPKDFKPPAAMLMKIADINDRLPHGSLSMTKSKDGEFYVFRNASFLLRTADADTLFEYLRQMVAARDLRKQLQGFVEEGK
jgi:hypothetical protein